MNRSIATKRQSYQLESVGQVRGPREDELGVVDTGGEELLDLPEAAAHEEDNLGHAAVVPASDKDRVRLGPAWGEGE